jgi:uncharacterized protein (TIGR02599 family)
VKHHPANCGFTLTEMVVTGSVLAIVLGVLLGLTDQTSRVVNGTSSKIEQFQGARLAFESMTRRLSHATLHNYWDYEYETVSRTIAGRKIHERVPADFRRHADFRFRSGPIAKLNLPSENIFRPTHGVFFQVPNGYAEAPVKRGVLNQLVNTCGYFVELNTDETSLPTAVRSRVLPRSRYRLMESIEPTERLSVYRFQQPRSISWFQPLVVSPDRPSRPLAENVVALVILPRMAPADEAEQRFRGASTTLAPGYAYDSTISTGEGALDTLHQLPPLVQVVMVAIDESSAQRLDANFRHLPALGLEYDNLFTDPEALDDDPATPEKGDGDVTKFAQMLGERLNVSYRVFSSKISIRGSKWSRGEEP